MSGSGWTCTLSPLSCGRSDALIAGSSYPAITLTVNVASNAPATVTNGAGVTGGASTTDPTATCGSGTTATMHDPAPGSTVSGSTVQLNWNCVTPAVEYWLFVGTTGPDSSDLVNQNEGTGTSQGVNLPASGTLYVRLWTYTYSSGWLSIDYTYQIGGGTVPITVTSSPITGLSVTVDGTAYPTPYTFAWIPGSSHTIGAATQSGGTGTQYAFVTWSDGVTAAHSVAPTVATTYTASFTTQYLLTTVVNPAGSGTITPATGWQNAGSVTLTAAANTGYQFSSFSGAVTGTTTPQNLTMSAPATVTATFTTMGSFTIEVLDSTTMRTVTSGAPMYVSRPTGSPIPYNFTIRATPINGFSGTINFNEYQGFSSANVSTSGISPITLNGSGPVLGSLPISVNASTVLGNATFTFNAVGNNISQASIPAYLNVTSGPLSATCSASPYPAAVGQSGTFSASPSGGTPPYTFSWSGAASGSGNQALFTELTAGIFTANLTVTDSRQPPLAARRSTPTPSSPAYRPGCP